MLTFDNLLNKQIDDEKTYFKFVKACYEEWKKRQFNNSYHNRITRYNMVLGNLYEDTCPQFFTGKINSQVVVVSLNPKHDPKNTREFNVNPLVASWEEYLNFWTNFPRERYSDNGVIRTKKLFSENRLSHFDVKLDMFLRGEKTSDKRKLRNRLSQWNFFHIELCPFPSQYFQLLNLTNELALYLLRSLEAISLFDRKLIIIPNKPTINVLRYLVSNKQIVLKEDKSIRSIHCDWYNQKKEHKEFDTDRRKLTVELKNKKQISLDLAPSFNINWMNGQPMLQYSNQFFSLDEKKILAQVCPDMEMGR